jgi:hypothetical protein
MCNGEKSLHHILLLIRSLMMGAYAPACLEGRVISVMSPPKIGPIYRAKHADTLNDDVMPTDKPKHAAMPTVAGMHTDGVKPPPPPEPPLEEPPPPEPPSEESASIFNIFKIIQSFVQSMPVKMTSR